jgi:hypothetical protein
MQSQGDFHVPGDVDTLRALGLPMTEGGTDVSAETCIGQWSRGVVVRAPAGPGLA